MMHRLKMKYAQNKHVKLSPDIKQERENKTDSFDK